MQKDDVIYRQAAIDTLRMDISMIPYAKAREYARAVIETIYSRLEELPSAQAEHIADDERKIAVLHKMVNYLLSRLEQRWIPVTERLPEVGTYVLISKKALNFRSNLPNVCTAHRSCDPRSGKEEWNDMLFGKLNDDDVLAWMPLPEAWKEGER